MSPLWLFVAAIVGYLAGRVARAKSEAETARLIELSIYAIGNVVAHHLKEHQKCELRASEGESETSH